MRESRPVTISLPYVFNDERSLIVRCDVREGQVIGEDECWFRS